MTTPNNPLQPTPQLSPGAVADLHRMADTDASQSAAHHTLGIAPTQATQGDHTHDGRNSKVLPDYATANHTHTTTPGTPAGAIIMYGSAVIPTGWLLCNGQAVPRDVYATLYAAIGNSFGAGDGSTTFNIPDFQSRMPLGVAGASPGMGATGGSTTHTHTTGDLALSVAQLPAHNHGTTVSDPTHSHGDDHNHAGPSHTHTGPDHNHSDDHLHTGPSHTHSEGSHSHGLGSHSHNDDHVHSGPSHTHTEGSHSHDQGTLKALRSTLAGASNITGVASSVNNQGSQTYDINISGSTGSNNGSGTGASGTGNTGAKSSAGYGTTTGAASGSTDANNGSGTGSSGTGNTGSKNAAGYGTTTGNAGTGATGSAGTGATNAKSTQGYGATTATATTGVTVSTSNTGSGSVHNHGATATYTGPVDPWLAVNFLIKT